MKKLLLFPILFLTSIFGLFSQENSLHLDGTNDYVNCGNNASLNITGTKITLEAWIYPTSFQANVWQGNVINKSGAGDNGYMIRVGNSGQVNFNLGTGFWNEINSATGAVTLNNWHHIAGTYDGVTMRLYVNGVQVASSALGTNIVTASNSLFLGDDPGNIGRYFPGRIEEVKIWNVARTAAQVVNDMNTSPCSPYPTGLKAYYRFNQGVAGANNAGITSVIDQTGVNNGTLTNSALNGGTSNWVGGKPAFPASTATFTYLPTCTGATATITGNYDGVFGFSPNPGGGVILNTSTGEITNGTAGATYTVQYTICGVSATVSVTLNSTNCWIMNGNASFIPNGAQQCIQLTPELNNQTGCAWDDNIIDFNSNFSLALNYYFGNNINGADGTTFTFQPNPSACGTNGGQLGAGGIANSLIIEFDTYDNDNPTHVVDIAEDHIAIEIDGDLQNASHLAGPIAALPSSAAIDDGAMHAVNIQWTSATKTLKVYFDGNLRLTTVYDFVALVFGGDNTVRWGATAATGGLNNQQYFCPQTIVILPTELSSFTTECDGESEKIAWTTASEDRVDYFEIEYTHDGTLFYSLAQVKASGTSTQTQFYSVDNTLDYIGNIYYRINSVDIDGQFETSDLISSKKCFESNSELLEGYMFTKNNLNIQLNEANLDLKLITTTGQELISTKTFNNSNIDFQQINVAQGIYLLQLTNPVSGKSKTYRIFCSEN